MDNDRLALQNATETAAIGNVTFYSLKKGATVSVAVPPETEQSVHVVRGEMRARNGEREVAATSGEIINFRPGETFIMTGVEEENKAWSHYPPPKEVETFCALI